MSDALVLDRPLTGLRTSATQLKLRVHRLAHAYPRELIGAGILAFAVSLALGSGVVPNPISPAAHAAPPAPPPLIMRTLAPDQALKVNATLPLASGPNPAAAPFAFRGTDSARAQALQCLASAIYYEAGNQDEAGERAVAQIVLNRVRHPAFPASVCGVVYEGSTRTTGCQFTFTCDGSLARLPASDAWRRATKVADEALFGYVYAPVGWATHYHASYVVPYWASSMAKNAIVGAHIFYRWGGSWGQPKVFSETYAGREPNAAALKSAALAVPHEVPVTTQGEVAEAIREIPGAEVLQLEPSMRGDKKVAVRFTLEARKASEDLVHEEYQKTFQGSDNLRWSLSSETAAADQQPLGRPSAPPVSSDKAAIASAGH